MKRTSSLTIGLAVIISASGCAQIDALEAHGLELREARLARQAHGAAPGARVARALMKCANRSTSLRTRTSIRPTQLP